MIEDVSSSVWASVATTTLMVLLVLPWWFGSRDSQASNAWKKIGISLGMVLILIGGGAICVSADPRILRSPVHFVLGSICFGFSILGIALVVWYLLLVVLRPKTTNDNRNDWQRQFTIYQLMGATLLLGAVFGVVRLLHDLPRRSMWLVFFFLAMVSMTVIAGGVVHFLLADGDSSLLRRRNRRGSKSITLPPDLSGQQQENEKNE
ncbi:hypothetical protein [Bremerella sp. P1]|uniref:hypothetical protein n=1 Tax=Bremerella sp. P1 TaxID=3026424 RepID=UPI002368E087|nr:hypothetical protein [Bremerella sp. P1]WDI42984.1 hypothetical protein PSR63_03370 [Bremerella sp. P1]